MWLVKYILLGVCLCRAATSENTDVPSESEEFFEVDVRKLISNNPIEFGTGMHGGNATRLLQKILCSWRSGVDLEETSEYSFANLVSVKSAKNDSKLRLYHLTILFAWSHSLIKRRKWHWLKEKYAEHLQVLYSTKLLKLMWSFSLFTR